jgi:hypothetical protein
MQQPVSMADCAGRKWAAVGGTGADQGRVPSLDLGRPQSLQRDGSQVRDNLLGGQFAIAL